MSLQIMGLATIDPDSHKVQTKLYKMPKFGVNRSNIVSKIQPFENFRIYKEMYGRRPDVHTFLC